AVSSRPEEPFAVVGAAEVPPTRAEEHVVAAPAPWFLGVPAGTVASRARAHLLHEHLRQERRQVGPAAPAGLGPPPVEMAVQLVQLPADAHLVAVDVLGVRPMTSLHRIPV